MSVELSFWKYEKALSVKDSEIYAQLSDGQFAQGVAELPIERILERVGEVLKYWKKIDDSHYETDDGLIELYITAQFIRFDCWQVPQATMNELIDVMLEHGCPLYDPVIDVRFC